MPSPVSNPRLVDYRLTRSKTIDLPSSPVYLITMFFQTRTFQDFVRVVISFRTVRQQRNHQVLGLRKALREFVKTKLMESRLGFGYQPGLAEIPEVPSDTIQRETYVQPMGCGHSSEPFRESGDICREPAIHAVRVTDSMDC